MSTYHSSKFVNAFNNPSNIMHTETHISMNFTQHTKDWTVTS